MSTETALAGAAPTPQAPATEQATTPVVVDLTSTTISDDVIAALVAEATPPGTQPPVVESEKPSEETPVEVVAPEVPEAPVVVTPPVETPVEGDLQGIQRPRFTDPDDQLIAALYKKHEREGSKISWAEAETRIKGTPAQAETPTEQPDPIAPLRDRLAEVDAKLDEAGANGDLLNTENVNLQKEGRNLAAKIAALEVSEQSFAKRDAQSAENATTQKFVTARNQVLADSVKVYPQMADRASVQWRRAKEINDAILADPNHPDRAVLESLRAPRIIADMAADSLEAEGVIVPRSSKTATPAATPIVSQTPQQATKPPVAPAPGSKATAPPPPAKTAQEELAELQNASANLYGGITFKPTRTRELVL